MASNFRWTPDNVERLLACQSDDDLATGFPHLPLHELKGLYWAFNSGARMPDAEGDSLPGESEGMAALRRALVNAQRQLAKQKEKTGLLVEATHRGALDAMLALGKVRPVPVPKLMTTGKGRPEVALWHMTDWQGSKKTPSYNSVVMCERVMRFAKRVAEITAIQRSHHPVNKTVILFGGDMIEGLFNFPGQVFEIDSTLFEQVVTVARLMVDLVRFALGIYETVDVIAEWGNHGRIGSKRDNVPRSDNFDRIAYELARQILFATEGTSRLTWEDCPEDIQRVVIGKYRALLIHGDEVGRNGFASPGTIVQHANRWRSGAYKVDGEPWPFRDVYIGHYHTHAEWPMANGEGAVYQTGSTESENRYARDNLAASAEPTQRLHFIDPERGRVTSQYKVWVGEEPAAARRAPRRSPAPKDAAA